MSNQSKERLSRTEFEVVGELVDDALQKTVASMERMLSIPFKVQFYSYGDEPIKEIPELDALGRFKAHVVKVSLKSEIKGALYFIINGQEIDQINKVVLPDEINASNKANSRRMKKGFMSEIENLIAALSITEISDSLGVELLGEVPRIEKMYGYEVNPYLQAENEAIETAFHVKAIFGGRHSMNISPYFIWLMDDNFLRTMRMNIVG